MKTKKNVTIEINEEIGTLLATALVNKWRWESQLIGGKLTIEDLFDLPLNAERRASLKEVAAVLNSMITVSNDFNFDFESDADNKNKQIEDQLKIVKWIAGYKYKEQQRKLEEKLEEQEKELQRKFAMEALLEKKKQNLESLSEEELKKLALGK